MEGNPLNWKHLSRREEEKETSIPKAAASEMEESNQSAPGVTDRISELIVNEIYPGKTGQRE